VTVRPLSPNSHALGWNSLNLSRISAALLPAPICLHTQYRDQDHSVEGRRKLAVTEDDRGLVIIVAHLGIAGG
jgi:hypothetical protein